MRRTLVANWNQAVSKYGNKLAFRVKKNRVWVDYTYREMDTMAKFLAIGLLSFKIKKGDRIAVIADDRLEWMITDVACQMLGTPNVPRGSDSTIEEIKYILTHSEAKILFVENEKLMLKIFNIIAELPLIEKIIVMDDSYRTTDKAIGFYDLIQKGNESGSAGLDEVERISHSIEEEDLATIIYTSGTTGQPKGVMLRQRNFMHNVATMLPLIKIYPEDHLLHILPVWHVFGRILEYLQIGAGASGAYTSLRELGMDMKEQKPTIMGSAPRLWESIYQRIMDGLKTASPAKKNLFLGAVSIARTFRQNVRCFKGNRLKLTPSSPMEEFFNRLINLFYIILYLPVFPLADKILGKVRAATGGEMRLTISGGGALPLHIDEFFEAVGINVLEGYGLTETSPILAVRTMEKLIPGCVGPLAPETMIQIRDDSGKPQPQGKRGVVWVKGPQVMKGYYKNEEATNKVLINGWFNTGDLGLITFNDTLKLMGRAKDTVVLLGGENVEPVPIENTLIESPYIHQTMVVGQDKKTLGALIVPDKEKLGKWCQEHGISYDEKNLEPILKNSAVIKLYADEIKKRVSGSTGFKNFERIAGFALIQKQFEVNDELTSIGKMKRHIITDKYKKEIEEIYKGN